MRQAFQVAGADHHQRMPRRCQPEQLGGHIAVALVDERFVHGGGFGGELVEGRFEHVAFLEPLDIGFLDLFARQQAGEQRAQRAHALPPGNTPIDPFQGDTDIAIDQFEGQIGRRTAIDRGAHFRPRLDAELVGQTLLIGAQREIGRHHAGLALAQYLEQIHLLEFAGAGERGMASVAEFDGDAVVVAGFDFVLHFFGAGARDVGGAQQRVSVLAAHDHAPWAAAVRVGRAVDFRHI